jgi:hypothetical protein
MSTNTDDIRDLELSPDDAEGVTGGHATRKKAIKKQKHSTPAQTSVMVNAQPLGATSDGTLTPAEADSDPDC